MRNAKKNYGLTYLSDGKITEKAENNLDALHLIVKSIWLPSVSGCPTKQGMSGDPVSSVRDHAGLRSLWASVHC